MNQVLSSVGLAFDFLSSVFQSVWEWVVSNPVVFLLLLVPLFYFVVGGLITLFQSYSRFDIESFTDSGFVGVFKRYQERKELKKKEGLAKRVFGQVENLDIQWVDIDGQRFYRPHRSRKYKVKLGERSATYYRADGDEVPVYDGKKQVRKKT